MLSAATGARRSEVIALRWSDINLPNRTVVISRGVVTGPNGLVEKDTKTHAARRVALDDRALVVLADHAKHMHANVIATRRPRSMSTHTSSNSPTEPPQM